MINLWRQPGSRGGGHKGWPGNPSPPPPPTHPPTHHHPPTHPPSQAKSKQKILDKMEADGLTKPVQRERTFQFQFPDCEKLPPPVLPFIDVRHAGIGGEGCEPIASGWRGSPLPPYEPVTFPPPPPSNPTTCPASSPVSCPLPIPPSGQLCLLRKGRGLPVPPPGAQCGLRLAYCPRGAHRSRCDQIVGRPLQVCG